MFWEIHLAAQSAALLYLRPSGLWFVCGEYAELGSKYEASSMAYILWIKLDVWKVTWAVANLPATLFYSTTTSVSASSAANK